MVLTSYESCESIMVCLPVVRYEGLEFCVQRFKVDTWVGLRCLGRLRSGCLDSNIRGEGVGPSQRRRVECVVHTDLSGARHALEM